MKKKYIILFLGCAVTAVALWYSMRQVRLADFIDALHQIKPWYLVPAFIAFYYSFYLRAVRWGLLFRPYHKLKGYQIFGPTVICFCFNNLLPARVGEFWRAWLVGKRDDIGVPRALATVLAERIIDAVTMLAMLGFSLWYLPKMNESLTVNLLGFSVSAKKFNVLQHELVILSAVMLVGLIVFMIPLTQRILAGIIQRLPISLRLKEKFVHILNQFAHGFHALHQPWVLAQIIFYSIVLWLLVGVSNMIMARGFGLPMNLPQGLAVMTLIGIFIMIPAAPGYWGLYEVGAIFSLIVLGLVGQDPKSQSLALAYALVLHLLQYLPIVVVGLYFAWRAHIRPAEQAPPLD